MIFFQPAWNHVECIVRAARLMEPGGDIEERQREFIRNSINLMLSKLYKTIRELQDELNQADNNIHKLDKSTQHISLHTVGEEITSMKSQITQLYKSNAMSGGKEKVYVVGPMGERPIHACAFAIAKHMDKGEQHIADGIFDGMTDFVEKPENAAVLCEPYGKDYCAAVASFFQQKCNPKESLKDVIKTVDLPYSKQIALWLKQHWKSNFIDVGVYQGETVHFALIACGYHKAVEWLIHNDHLKSIESKSDSTSASPDQTKPKWRRYCSYWPLYIRFKL
jgi:hypothetical protein